MKIILSRKGFDSKNGGFPSPIMPDGTMLSMPIPGNSEITYSDIKFNGQKYCEILDQLRPKNTVSVSQCHVDPDIRKGIRIKPVSGWILAFGQVGSAQTHLENQHINKNDIFLFFGWFKQTEINNYGRLIYKRGAPDIQAIYGYLQIGDIVKNDLIHNFPWHPHSDMTAYTELNNTLYVPSDTLIINNKETGLPGYGTFKFSSKIVLTKEGLRRSKWEILDWFYDSVISFHTKENIKDTYFQSAYIGQEFVVSENTKVTEWVESILCPSLT